MSACLVCEKENLETEVVLKCGHKVCHKCLCSHIEKLTSAKVSCPVDGCPKMVQEPLIRKCLPNNKIEYYDRLCMSANTVKCLIKDCPYFVAYEEKGGNFVCPVCDQPNCLECGQLHQESEGCQRQKKHNSDQFEKMAFSSLVVKRKKDLYNNADTYDLIPNSDKFDCPVCGEFILPRSGVSLRNCMDTICKLCLQGYVGSVDNIRNLNCPLAVCGRPLTERECRELLGKDKLQQLCLDVVKARMYNCQNPGCKGLWDFAAYTGQHKCPVCGISNCAYCKDTHEGLTCEKFRLTKRFLDAEVFRKKLEEKKSISCHNCRVMIIKNKGCNALRCPGCRLQVCAYSGMEIGPKGCKCTNSKRCVVGCNPGCIPEGDSPYEKALYAYFYKKE